MSGGLSATRVMLIAIGAGVIGRWANNKKALPGIGGMLEVVGALILISLLDTGRTRVVAQGFAWLFFAAVMLSDSSPITGLAKAEGAQGAGRIPTPTTGGAPAGALDSPAAAGRNTTPRS